MVQLCPAIATNPNIKLNVPGDKPVGLTNLASQVVTKNPLKISKIKTNMPIGFPNTLKAFVAPILPEPSLRISIPLNNFPSKKAVGIDPIR